MRIAILGGGFAGLATMWHLLSLSSASVSIDLYDPLPIGKGVSGMSSGLLYPFAGKDAKKVRYGDKEMDAAHTLITEASRAISSPIISAKGILRPITTSLQKETFGKTASLYPGECFLWGKEECEEKVKGLKAAYGGLYIPHGVTLDVETYLQGLCQACVRLGAQVIPKAITTEAELAHYDKIVATLGIGITSFSSLADLPVVGVKGEALICKWPSSLPPLAFSLISEGYLTMKKDGLCVAGSTFERTYTTSTPNPSFSIPEITRKILPFFPHFPEFEVVSCVAGIRASSKQGHHPILGRSGPKTWFMTGLGSKGLLYHAWLGRQLAKSVLSNDPSYIPKEFYLSC